MHHTVRTRTHSLAQDLICALGYLFLSLSLASAQPCDVGQRIRSEKLEEQVLIPVQVETSLKELNSQPKEVNLQTILAPYAEGRTQVQAVLNLLGNRGGSPGELSVSVRLLNSRFFDDVIAREYRDRIATFAYTGCRRDGYKFFQQSGYSPIRHDLWQAACNGDSEESERIFAEARAGGEVVLLDGDGKLYRLTKDFSLTKLSVNGIDGVVHVGDTVYGAITEAGQSLGSFLSTDNASTFDLSEAIPSIYAFSLRRKGDESPGTTLHYYVSIGISSPQGENADPLFAPAAIIPIQVAVEAEAEVCSDGVDNDSDGMIDCGDPDCSGAGNCITPPEDCYNSTDDDMDGAADCSDSDCASLPSCAPPVEICDNGFDDDGDGIPDCSDSDCNGSPSCVTPSEDCSNGVDDDGDGNTDCSDPDCQNTFTCTACSAECPYGGGSCICAPTYWGWGSCSCDCSSCPQQPQNPEFLTLSESQSYPLGCYSNELSFQARFPVYGDYVVNVDGQNVSYLGWMSGDRGISLSLSLGYHQITLVNQSSGGSASVNISVYYSCQSEDCSNRSDDDGDGSIDCTDPDCASYWACFSMPEVCSDGIDNDKDGSTDCSDFECSSASNCSTQQEYCYDGYDNDGDMLIDCNDSDCPGCIVYSEECNDGSDNDYDGLFDCSDPDCAADYRCHPPREYDCANNADDNWNWMIDCADPDCVGNEACIYMPEVCDDNVDNDRDGRFDCEDDDCASAPSCRDSSEICDDGVDNDDDGLIDCEDVDQCACADIELCSREGDEDANGHADCFDKRCAQYPGCENVSHEVCGNGVDDDGNGFLDCDDYWCQGQSECIPKEICANGNDDDGDGAIDCSDSDCSSDPSCVPLREDCTNGRDDDGDDQIDGDDSSCRGSEVIPAEGTPLATFDPLFGIRLGDQSPRIVRITDSTWRLETATEDAAPVERTPVRVQIRDGVIEAAFAQEERGVFQEYLAPNTRYRLIFSLRGVDANGKEFAIADRYVQLFTTSDTAVLPDGVVLVRHDLVLEAREVSTPVPTETPVTVEVECGDSADNDGDGASDCADSDCSGSSSCITPPEDCSNGFDDDRDGSIDCADTDCSGSGNCITPPEDCYNGRDDDGDGTTDCADFDCASLPSCAPPVEICDNGFDDDSDGSYDCSDSDCNGSPSCIRPTEDCSNGVDDDGDGNTDCSDPDCQNSYTCTVCSAECPYGGGSCSCSNAWWGWGSCSCDCSGCPQQPQNPEFLSLSESQSYPLGCFSSEFSFQARLPTYGNYDLYVDGQSVRTLGWMSGDQSISVSLSAGYHQLTLNNQSAGRSASVNISVYYSCQPEDCSNRSDDDGDGSIDCTDPDCTSYWACFSMPEVCSDGIDNDNDGSTDCSDLECSSASNCSTQQEYCSDGYDNDGDMLIDCNDSDCPGCIVYSEECNDGSDNDYDGLFDCSDPDCAADHRCHPPREYDCANNADDDWDWMIDCSDPDCSSADNCVEKVEDCLNGEDDDGDGRIDDDDSSCRGSEVIPPDGTPIATNDPVVGIRGPNGAAQIATITESTWKLEELPANSEEGTAGVAPRVFEPVLVQLRDGVIEAFFSVEERGVFKEYLSPNTRYRLTVSVRGLDINGAETIVAEQHTQYFTTPEVATLPEGVLLVRHDIVLESRAVPTATPTETATATVPPSETDCADGVDNDGDLFADCNDSDCSSAAACLSCVSTGMEFCSNGTDDDCDGSVDCGDADCSGAVECQGSGTTGGTTGSSTGGTTGGTTGGPTATPTPILHIPFVRNIVDKGNIGIVCGEKTFDAEVALPQGGASDLLTLILYEVYYKAQKDPKTGAMIGVPQYREIQSESFRSFPQEPVRLKFNNSPAAHRLELVNYLGAKSYQTILDFEVKEDCPDTPVPTEEPEDVTPTAEPTDTPAPTATPTPTPPTQINNGNNDGGKDPCDEVDPSSGSAPTGGSEEFSTMEDNEGGVANGQSTFNLPVVKVGGGSGSGDPNEKPSAVTEKGAPNLSEEEQKNLPTEQSPTFSEQETADQIMKDPALVTAEQKARDSLDKLYETEEKVKAGTATQAELTKAQTDYKAAKSAFDAKVDSAVSQLSDSSHPDKGGAAASLKSNSGVSYYRFDPATANRKEVEVVPVNGSSQPTTSKPTSPEPDSSGVRPSDAALANLRIAQGKAARAMAGAAMNSQGAQRNFDNSVRLAQNVSLMGELLGLGDDALKQLEVERENLKQALARERELKEQQRDLDQAEKNVGLMYEKAAALDKDGYKDAADLVRKQADALAAKWADSDISALSFDGARAYREGLQELNQRLDETILLAQIGGTSASVVRETAHVAGVGVGFVMGGPAGGAAVNQGLRMVEGATEELTKVAMGEQSYEEAHDAFVDRSKQALVESGITLVAGAAGSKLNKVVGAMSGPVAAKTVDIVGTGLVQSGGTAIQIGVEFAQAKSEFDKENAGLTGAERERAYNDFMAQNGFTLEQVSKRLGVSFGAGAAAKVLGGLAKKFGDETEEFTSELGEQLGNGQPLTAETLVAAAVGSHATKRGINSSAGSQNGGIAPPAPNDPPHVQAAASKVEDTKAAYEAAKASGQNVEAAEAAYKSAISHDNAVRQDHVDKPVEKPSTVVETARNQLIQRVDKAPTVEVTSVSEKGTRDPVLPNGTRVAATTGYRDVTFKDAQGNTQQGIAFRGDSGKTEMGSVLHMYDKVNLPGNEKLKALLPEFKGKFEKDGVTYLVFEKLSGDKPLSEFDQLPDAAQRQLTEILKPEFLESVKNTGLNQSRIFEADYIFQQPDGTVRMGIPFRAFDFSTELPKMFDVKTPGTSGRESNLLKLKESAEKPVSRNVDQSQLRKTWGLNGGDPLELHITFASTWGEPDVEGLRNYYGPERVKEGENGQHTVTLKPGDKILLTRLVRNLSPASAHEILKTGVITPRVLHDADFDAAAFTSRYPTVEERFWGQWNTGKTGISTSLHQPYQDIPGNSAPGLVSQLYTFEVPVENVVYVRQPGQVSANSLDLPADVRERPEEFVFLPVDRSVGDSGREFLNEESEAIFVGNFVPKQYVKDIQTNVGTADKKNDISRLPTGAAGGSTKQTAKPFDPTTLDQPDSPLMFQPNSPYVESGFVGRTNLSKTNESLRRVYTDRPAMAAEFSTMENPPKLMHGSTSASLLMYITPQNQTGKEQTAQDQLRSQNRQGQLRPSGAIEASLGAVFSGEIVFGKSNTDIAVVDVTDIGTALDYAEGRHAGHSNSMNWSPEIAHQRMADANELLAKEEKMAREGGFSETYQNSQAARRNKGTKATEDLRLAEWENLSSLEKSLVSQQFPVVYGIDTSRQGAVSLPMFSDVRSELRLQGGTTGDEIRAVFVPKDKIPLVQSLVGDKGPRVLDIDLLKPESALNQPNQADAASNRGAIQPAPVDAVQDPTEVVKALVEQSGGADLASTIARTISRDGLINLERRYDAMLARDKRLELSPEEIAAFRQEVTTTLDGVRQSLAAQGVDATLMRGPHGYPILELDGGGDTRLGRVVGNAKSQFERRSGGAPLRVTWDPIGNVQEQAGGFYENRTRTLNLGRNGVLNPDALDPTTIHELGHAFRHAKLLGAAAARKAGDVEGLQKLHDPLYGRVANTHQDFSLGDTSATVDYKNYSFDEVASWRSDVTTNLANISRAIERGDHATASATLRSANDGASLYVGLSARLRAVTAQLEATLSKPRSGAGAFFHGDGLNGHVDFIPSPRFDGVEAIATFVKHDAAGQTKDSFKVSIPLIEATGVGAGDFERNVELLRAQVRRSREALDGEVNGFEHYTTRLRELGASIQ